MSLAACSRWLSDAQHCSFLKLDINDQENAIYSETWCGVMSLLLNVINTCGRRYANGRWVQQRTLLTPMSLLPIDHGELCLETEVCTRMQARKRATCTTSKSYKESSNQSVASWTSRWQTLRMRQRWRRTCRVNLSRNVNGFRVCSRTSRAGAF